MRMLHLAFDSSFSLTFTCNPDRSFTGSCKLQRHQIAINSHYEKVKEALCGGGTPGVATGLEAAWGVLFVVSLLWIPLLFCMCQATKHADQGRHGGLNSLEFPEVHEDIQKETGDTVNVRILLGEPFNKAVANKAEASEVARICIEVRDRLAIASDIPREYFKVTSPGANDLTLPASYLPIVPHIDLRNIHYYTDIARSASPF